MKYRGRADKFLIWRPPSRHIPPYSVRVSRSHALTTSGEARSMPGFSVVLCRAGLWMVTFDAYTHDPGETNREVPDTGMASVARQFRYNITAHSPFLGI